MLAVTFDPTRQVYTVLSVILAKARIHLMIRCLMDSILRFANGASLHRFFGLRRNDSYSIAGLIVPR